MNRLKKLLASTLVAAVAMISAESAMADINIKPSPNGEVALVVNFKVKPGLDAEFEKIFQRSVICSRLEPGNVTFNVHRVLGEKHSYVLYEVWRNKAALNSHFARPYTKVLFSMFDRDLVTPLSEGEGGLHFVADLDPATRSAPSKTDPATFEECR